MARSPPVLTRYDEAEMACVSNVTHQNLDTTHSFVENHTQSFDFAKMLSENDPMNGRV